MPISTFSYKQYCGPYGHTASIFNGIWIKLSVAMVVILDLDKLSLKKLNSRTNTKKNVQKSQAVVENKDNWVYPPCPAFTKPNNRQSQ